MLLAGLSEEPQIYLVFSNPGDIRECNLSLVKDLTANGINVMIITSNQPAKILEMYYQKNGIDTVKIDIIDMITKYSGGPADSDTPHITYIKHPSDLTSLGILISDKISKSSGNRFILIDSINSMQIYISSSRLSRFLHYITNHLRLHMISGGFIAIEKGFDPVIRSQLEVLTDNIVTFDELKMSSKFDTIMSTGPAESGGKGKIGKYLEDLEKSGEEVKKQEETTPQEEVSTPAEEPVKKTEETKPQEEVSTPAEEPARKPEESGTPGEEEVEKPSETPPAENRINEGKTLQTAAFGESVAGEKSQPVGNIGKIMQQLDEQNHS